MCHLIYQKIEIINICLYYYKNINNEFKNLNFEQYNKIKYALRPIKHQIIEKFVILSNMECGDFIKNKFANFELKNTCQIYVYPEEVKMHMSYNVTYDIYKQKYLE